MSKTIHITREYDDDGKLTSETKTTKLESYIEPEPVPFGFGLPPMTINAKVKDE